MDNTRNGAQSTPCTRIHGVPVNAVLDVATELDAALADENRDRQAVAENAMRRLYALVTEHGEAIDQWEVRGRRAEPAANVTRGI